MSFNSGLKNIKWLCLLNNLEGYSRAEHPYMRKIADLRIRFTTSSLSFKMVWEMCCITHKLGNCQTRVLFYRICWDTTTKSLSGNLIYLSVMNINVDCVSENSFASHTIHYSSPKIKWKEKYKMYKHKDANWSVCSYSCITKPFADPGGILLISPERHRWLVTAVVIFEWEKHLKDVSTMIEYDLYIIIMLEILRKEVDFEEKVFIFHWVLTLPL